MTSKEVSTKHVRFAISLSLVGVLAGAAALAIAWHATSSLESKVLSELSAMDTQIENAKPVPVSDSEFQDKVENALTSIIEDRRQAAAEQKAKRIQNSQSERVMEGDVPVSMNEQGQVVFGNPDAAITVHVFEDFRCGFCNLYHPLIGDYVAQSQGEVNYIYKPFPILGPESMKLANAAECVAQEEGPQAFRTFSSLAYKTKDADFSISKSGLENPDNIRECMQERRYSSRITESMSEGRDLNVTGTPASVFRNNDTGKGFLMSGKLESHQIEELVTEALNGN